MRFEHVLVVGAGQMGGGIGQVVAASGRRVSLHDAAPGAVERGLETMRKSLGKLAEKGGSDPDEVLSRDILLNGDPYTVVGVVADNVQFSRPAEIWTLSPPFPDIPRLRAMRAFDVVARLKPGVTMEAAKAELGAIADRLAREYPEANKGAGVIVDPIRAGIVGRDLQTTAVFLMGVVGFVLLLCCANVANLLLARATARGREIAVRSALGAGRGRIIRQLLTESLVLAIWRVSTPSV